VTLAVCKFPQVNFSGDERKIYNSPPGVGRAFCAECGTPLTWEASLGDLGLVGALHSSTFDNPNVLISTSHSFFSDRVSWFDIAENLPRYEDFVMDGLLPRRGPAIAEPSD